MRLWISIAFVCLAAAIAQCLAVADRVRHAATIAWKEGVEEHLISAGASMVIIFFVATVLFVVLGLLATDRLRKAESPMRFCSLLSVQMLLAGALVWGGLLCTPFVLIVSR